MSDTNEIDRLISRLRKPEDIPETREERIRKLMLSAAAGGMGLGAGTSILAKGTKTFKDVAKAAGKGGLISALLAGTAGTAGDLVLGDPEPGEKNAFMKRGAVGGLVGGALLGGAGGALAASGKVGKYLGTGKLAEKLSKLVPEENMVANKFKTWAGNPSRGRTTLGGLLGGGLGSAGSAFVGADEGMQADIIAEQAQKLKPKRRTYQRERSNDGL